MGSRMIRDGLLDSDRYWSVSTNARQMFVHLLLLADDFGCVSLSATFIRRRCFNDMPSHERIARLISELSDMDLIRPYEVDRACYGFIPRFKQKLQRVTLKHPAPPEHLLEGDADAIEKFSKQRAASAGEIILPFGKEWDALKAQAFARDGHACIRCNATEDLHGHHLIPKSKGGPTTLENIATLCGSCNSWARNNDEKCQQIREIAKKASSDRMLASISKITGHIPEVEVKRSEEKRSEEKTSLSGKPDLMPQVREVLQFLRNMTGRQYREVDATVNLIKARLKNTPIADIKRMLAYKGDQWLDDPVMEKYLRPATLFGATKFEQYLAEALAHEQN